MAFDQNSMPVDLRPINVARSSGEEARINPSPVTTSGRPLDGFYSNPAAAARLDVTSPPSMPVYYTDTPGAGFPGMVLVNPGGPNMGQAAWWAPRMHAPVGPMPAASISSSGYANSPNLGAKISGGGGSGSSSGAVHGSGNDQASEDGGDDSVSGRKVKFLCSFGGKILPRPSDGMLRYVGGQTRIISVRRDVTFGELVQKMVDMYGQPIVIKYQLPDEDLDALVSVSCSDDLDNMMEEYEKLQERSPDGSAKLRVFLFSASELDSSGLVQLSGLQDTGLRYVDAVNGVAEGIVGGITRKESIASVASTQNSDVSGSEVFETAVGQDVNGPPSANMFSPRSDSVPSYDNAPRFEISAPPSAPPLIVPVGVSPHSGASESEFEQDRAVAAQTQGQKQPFGYDLQQSGINMQPRTSPYLAGYMDPHQDAINRGAPQMVYANPQVFGAPRPILIQPQPQYRDSSPNLMNPQFMPAVQMTMAPNSSHMSMNPNMLQPLVQSSQRVVAIPADPNAYQSQVGGSYRWPQVMPQDQVAFSEGWMSHQQMVPTTADCYRYQNSLPHAPSDSVVQEPKVTPSTNVSNTSSIYQTLRADDINRLHATTLQNQGLMGLTTDAPSSYGTLRGNVVVSGPEDTMQQHLVSNQQHLVSNQQHLASNQVNDGFVVPPIGAVYHPSEQFIVETSKDSSGKVAGMAFKEDSVRPAISKDHVRPTEFKIENLQTQHLEQGKSHDMLEHVSPQSLGLEMLPNGRPTMLQETSQISQHDMVPCSVVEVQHQYNDNSTGIDTRVDATRISPETIALNSNVHSSNSPQNWGLNDSTNSLFSNQDPWNMRHETSLPPKPSSKITAKREASAADNRQNGESNAGSKIVDILPTSEQAQSGKGSAEDQIKQQLQATAEGVAASVLHSSMASNVDFSSRETSSSETNHEAGEQTNSDAVIKTKMEALNIKSDKANFGFPLSEGLGRLQIIKNGDLEELRELGSGTFGTVYHGKWRGTDVAIKRINDRCFVGKTSEQERMRDDFWNEAIKLADLHHPNVVAFYGVVLDGPDCSVATVTEYMVNGSLRTALQKNEKNLDKRKRLLIAMDVAFGMEYLHSKNIVHFDLKSDNLLVNLRDPHRPICKVGDLGLSKVKCQTLISGGVRGTLPWMAPELLNGSSSLVSEKVDVFSFGIVMWELLTGEEPYADLHYGAIIGGIVSNTLRPPVPEFCDPEWRSLMERCWSAEPPERPNFTEIANELRVMASKVPAKAQSPAATPTTRTNT